MKKKKKIKLKYGKERVLFSDILPYETPLIFSNRYFYRFVSKYKWHFDSKGYLRSGGGIIDNDAFNYACLLFGAYNTQDFENIKIEQRQLFYPFQFNIAHKIGRNRILSVIHPYNQLQMVEFYEKYKSVILYLCNRSNFSLRKPSKVAQYFYFKDRLHANLLGKKRDSVELYFNEYENLKSYFSYQKYPNIYKFYEDYRYQRAEKKFKHLLKFDIQSCFDSIYTHSISWAVSGGRDHVKQLKSYSGSCLGDKFDDIMQSVNARETNGIVIGPEFSRIFAEIILQRIDIEVEKEIARSELKHKVHYECYRYVDDYFLFYNDEKDRQVIIESFTNWLDQYKLKISPSKTIEYTRPFVTNLTMAKLKFNDLLQRLFKQKLWDLDETASIPVEDLEDEADCSSSSSDDKDLFDKETSYKCLSSAISLYVNPNNTIAEIKAIIKEIDVSYNDVSNYVLEILGRKIDVFLTNYDKGYKALIFLRADVGDSDSQIEYKTNSAEKQLANFLNGIIDIASFIYNSNRQVNTTLKLQKLLNSIIIYVRSDYQQNNNRLVRFTNFYRDTVLKKVQDELSLVIMTTGKQNNTIHECIYLLILSKSLGTKFMFSHQLMEQYLDPDKIKHNMFSIQVLLYYYGNHIKYDQLKQKLIKILLNYYDKTPENSRAKSSELTILTSDLMACPYINDELKAQLLCKMGIKEEAIKQSIIKFAVRNKFLFTKWTNFDLNKELQAKISQEVYS